MYSGEPWGNQFQTVIHSWAVIGLSLFKNYHYQHIHYLLICQKGTGSFFESFWVEGYLSFFHFQKNSLNDLSIAGDIFPVHIVTHKGISHINGPLLHNQKEGHPSLLNTVFPAVAPQNQIKDIQSWFLLILRYHVITVSFPVKHPLYRRIVKVILLIIFVLQVHSLSISPLFHRGTAFF